MTIEDIKSEIRTFLNENPMTTISTINHLTKGPESALVAFAELATLELIFETFHIARKYDNLRQDGRVSFVIGWDIKRHITVQYEGIASELSGDDIEVYRQIFIDKKTPCTEQFLRDPRVRLFKVSPTWLRYSDYTLGTPRIIELTVNDQGDMAISYRS